MLLVMFVGSIGIMCLTRIHKAHYLLSIQNVFDKKHVKKVQSRLNKKKLLLKR